jgi:hypothetical protein
MDAICTGCLKRTESSSHSKKMRTSRAKAKIAGSLEETEARLEIQPVVLTLGHSARSLEEFLSLLRAHGVTRVVDVRTVPRSRHNPQFNKTSLPRSLKKIGIGYVHLPGLGGLRHAVGDSINSAWRNSSFRGYADYMQTQDFDNNLRELIRLAKFDRVAFDVCGSGALAVSPYGGVSL